MASRIAAKPKTSPNEATSSNAGASTAKKSSPGGPQENKGTPKNKFSNVLKVVQLGPENDANAGGKVVTTLSTTDLDDATLGQVTKKLDTTKLPNDAQFCYQDYSHASDETLLSDYLLHENEGIDFSKRTQKGETTTIIPRVLCITPPAPVAEEPPKKPNTSASTLTKTEYVLKVYEWSDEGVSSRGVVESSKLSVPDASRLTLAGLRRVLSTCTKMSVSPEKHKFCTPSGMAAGDESMSFGAYLKLEEVEADEQSELPAVHVFYKLDHPKNEFMKFNLEDLPGKVEKEDWKLTGAEFDGGKQADTLVGKEHWSQIAEQNFTKGASSNPYAIDAGYLTEGEWTEVLRNCGIMYGWIIDREKNRIARAPKPAFQLRPKKSTHPVHSIPDIVPSLKASSGPRFPDLPESGVGDLKACLGMQAPAQSRDPSSEAPKSRVEELKGRISMTLSPRRSGGILPTNKDLLTALDDQIRDRSAAEALKHKTSQDTEGEIDSKYRAPSKESEEDEDQDDTHSPTTEVESHDNIRDCRAGVQQGPQHYDADEAEVEALDSETQLAAAKARAQTSLPPRRPTKEVFSDMPTYQVNDDSRIEITVASHEFEFSMARNDFSGHSTEGSMSGGYGGFAASVSAGYEKNTSKGSKVTTNTFKKTMVAKYMFPRADVLLHPDDLEPTPELKAALDKVRNSRNIADLRQLQDDFGQLWCQRVTVGGRLQSTKIMADQTGSKEQEEKESFKMSVGVQVSTPFGVGGGVKHGRQGGTQTQNNERNEQKNEQNVFEAVSSNTVLAANPELWAPTVADYRNWRVIERGTLSALVDAIAAIEGYSKVREWFLLALPTLMKYIQLPASKEITLRFKVLQPTTQLSLSYLKKSENYTEASDPKYYLGRTTDAQVKPVESIVRGEFWAQSDIVDAKPLFSPASYRAPVLLGYAGNKVGDSAFGAEYSEEYTNTLWNVSAPFNDELHHGCRVCIQTVPPKGAEVKAGDKPSDIKEVLSLAVSRNQQSVFLPVLTSAAERHFFRIHKVGATTQREYIKEGDPVYFSWAFADQTCGFRDFEDDVFGRRRLTVPPELLSRVLYLKLPWPRFEPLQKPAAGQKVVPNTMILSPEPPTFDGIPKPIAIKTVPAAAMAARQAVKYIKVPDTATYAVQDIIFRVDMVGNNGRGEADDQMLHDVDQGQGHDAYKELLARLKQLNLLFAHNVFEKLLFLGR